MRRGHSPGPWRSPNIGARVAGVGLPGAPATNGHRECAENGPGSLSVTKLRATWNGAVLAESDDAVIVEGNCYFPATSVHPQYLRESATTTRCPWKGIASYYDVVVDGKDNPDAAWYYSDPSAAAGEVAGRVAFWHGVRIERAGDDALSDDSRFARLRRS